MDNGEAVIYKRLSELQNVGMFVVHGFGLTDVLKKKKEGNTQDSLLSLSTVHECDFIIFHHTFGVILLQVKGNALAFAEAEAQLQVSHGLVETLAAIDKRDSHLRLPHKKVIALPSTKKSEFSRDEFPTLKEDTVLLFEEDSNDADAFQKWWQETVENPAALAQMMPENLKSYEQALAYTLMIRHLGPVTETDCIAELHEILVSQKCHGKAAYPQFLKGSFPHFWSWCRTVFNMSDDQTFDLGEENFEELMARFQEKHSVNDEEIKSLRGMEIIDTLLKHSKYISGNTLSILDRAIVEKFADTRFLFYENILRFVSDMRHRLDYTEEEEDVEWSPVLDKFPFLKLESRRDHNMLDQHFSRSLFIEGTEPTKVDRMLFKKITCQFRRYLPIVLTSEQLAVFEGPLKQLIIGPPGSGKTELMKFKARELEIEMEAAKLDGKILYIVGNGAPKRKSFIYYSTMDFFKDSRQVDVITIIIEADKMKDTKVDIRRRIASGKYKHVFIDEYWIGAKVVEQDIILELIAATPGYVWITSVFDFREDLLETHEKLMYRTKPLLEALKKKGGTVSRIPKVLRATNTIIELEKMYGSFYQGRSYPYGTKEVLGHSLEGLPISWVVEKGLQNMYAKCTEIVNSAVRDVLELDVSLDGKKLALNPSDILIVNFAVRMRESASKNLKQHLDIKNLPVWMVDFKDPPECNTGKMTLLQSHTRQDSSYLDGMEWPMVVVILPSSLLLGTAPLAHGAPSLRNYDTYIAMFRAVVKLVVISDKWTNQEEFLADVEQRP